MELLIPGVGLILWTVAALTSLLLLCIAFVHLLLNKRIEGREAVRWAFCILFLPFVGPILYFKAMARQTKLKHTH